MKENYENLEMEVIVFENEDIICTSTEDGEGDEVPAEGRSNRLA